MPRFAPDTTAPRDGPALVADLVSRALEHAGVGAAPERRRDALRELLETWRPDERELALCADGDDVVGTAYERLLSGAERRDAGQFATPLYAADLMAAWLLREPVRLLLDPGVGSGRLLYRAGIRTSAPERLLGIDTDPLALELARRNLEWRGLADRARVCRGDFLLEEWGAERPDAATVNPPYSRHHAVPPAVKAAIHDGFESRLGVRFSGLAALHALFFVRTIEVCAPGARIAFITPGDWLDAAYGRTVKRWALDHARVEGLVFFPEDALPFGGTVMSSAVVTLVRKHETGGDGVAARARAAATTRVIRLSHEPPCVERVLDALTGGTEHSLAVEDVELGAIAKWSRPAPRRAGGTRLSELARVRRGIATGNNRFFVVSEVVRRRWQLPVEDLRPCLSSPRALAGREVTTMDLDALPDDAPRWVLACRRPGEEDEDGPLGAYLRHGRELGIPDGYLASRRRPWYGLDRRQPPAVLWPYFTRGRPRFVRNRADALPLNTWLGIEPHDDVDPDALWTALNDPSTMEHLLASRRSYAGMSKLEPTELGDVRVRWRARPR